MKSTESKTSTAKSPQTQEATSFFFKKDVEQSFFSEATPKKDSFFSPNNIQTKLTVGQPGDKYEQEADAMADQVVQKLAENNVQPKSNSESPTLQNQPHSAGSSTQSVSPSLQLKCAECTHEEKLQPKEEEPTEETLQLKPIFESNPEPPEEGAIQRKCSVCGKEESIQRKEESGPSTASPDLESQLNSTKGGGSPLPEGTQNQIEGAFDADFSGVRVHTNSGAVQMNQELGAQAFTHGSDVYFNSGKYSPDNSDGQKLLAHELTHTIQQSGEIIRRSPEAAQGLIISGNTFQEAAQNFANLLRQNNQVDPARIVIINGSSIRVYTESANPIGGVFHLKRPGLMVPIGVYRTLPGRGSALHIILRQANGSVSISQGVAAGNVNFSEDVEPQDHFNRSLEGGHFTYYVSPSANTQIPVEDERPEPEIPEFMRITPTGSANMPAWPAAVIPLTPQVTSSNSTGSYVMRVQKNIGLNTLDRVTNLMEPTNFYWEVLKLNNDRVVNRQATTRIDAVRQRYERRIQQVHDDRQVILGETQRQSVPENVVRTYIAQQVADSRTILAMVGETAMTVVHALTSGSGTPNIEDFIDVPWNEPGDYFIRCLATPVHRENAPNRRATSVAGVMVSVFDIAEIARESLPSVQDEGQQASSRMSEIDEELAEIDQNFDDSSSDDSVRLNLLDFERTYQQSIIEAHGDTRALQRAELNYANVLITFYTGPNRPPGRENIARNESELRRLRTRVQQINNTLNAAERRLGAGVNYIAMMSAVFVNEVTGTRTNLTFTIGERTYVSRDLLEVVLVDVTDEHGGRFNGNGDGFLGAGRADAWRNALLDMRRNLGRGRGWLSYRVPTIYSAIETNLPNPMQLQMAPTDQVREMVDDTAHVATLAALVAAPFTGGASLSILGVLAPIQAASSLYNIVNRAAYDRLSLDAEAISDFINIISLGVGRVGTASRFASRGIQMLFTSGRVAAKLLDYGGYVVMTYQAYQQLTAEVEGEDPREGRRRRLIALLNLLEGASLPVASHLWPHGSHPTRGSSPEATSTQPRPPHRESSPSGPADYPDAFGHTHNEHFPSYMESPLASSTRSREAMAALEIEIPQLLRDQGVHLVENGNLPGDTVRVYYENDRIRVEIGVTAAPRNVRLHVPTMRQLSRYQGIWGRVYRLISRINNFIIGQPGYGTEGFESRLEVRKLNDILTDLRNRQQQIRERVDRLNGDRNLAGTLAEQRAIAEEIRSIEGQLQEHEANVHSMEPGRGYVAADDRRTGAPRDWRVQQVNYTNFENFSHLLRRSGTVLEFPDGLRVWRTRTGAIAQDHIVGPSIGRQGYENQYESWGQAGHDGPTQERAHSHGQGTGAESPFAIRFAPREVNQYLQNQGIEGYLRSLRDVLPVGTQLVMRTETLTRPGSLRLDTIRYRVDIVQSGRVSPGFEFGIRVGGSTQRPVITTEPIEFFHNSGAEYIQSLDVDIPEILMDPNQ